MIFNIWTRTDMIIRFRSKDGQYRLNCESNTPFGDLLNELILTKLPAIDPDSLSVQMPGPGLGPGVERRAGDVAPATVEDLKLKNGDMLVLSYVPASAQNTGQSISGKVGPDGSVATKQAAEVQSNRQSALDDELDKDPGLIARTRSALCRHGDKGMCEYCSPLPPWDREYQADNNIKHISFHAYVDELNSKVNKKEGGSSYVPPLKPSNFAINKHCPSGHEPWPRGICSKCQPPAITLQRQEFRMVDHVEFRNSETVNNFINSWRLSGTQRIGLLLGRYARYDKIPLGIKAEVEAIYEFSQKDLEDGLVLNEWERGEEEAVLRLCEPLGLVPVGIIFTDLSDSGKGDGSVICKRHVNSFFLSSLEVVFAVKWQLRFANRCRWSESGVFGSKFVTCVISGNTSGEIDISAYQASEAAQGLVGADLICPSTHPDQMFIHETDSTRYVPDIFYQKINEYGLQVKHSAKPSFPVEFLVVSLTHGFPEQGAGLFTESPSFPTEHREYLGERADLTALADHFRHAMPPDPSGPQPGPVLREMSNWHVLFYILSQTDVLSPDEAASLLAAVAQQDAAAALRVAQSPGWKTLHTLCRMV